MNQSTTLPSTLPRRSNSAPTISVTGFKASIARFIASVKDVDSFSPLAIFSSSGESSMNVPITGLVDSNCMDLLTFSPAFFTWPRNGGKPPITCPKLSKADV